MGKGHTAMTLAGFSTCRAGSREPGRARSPEGSAERFRRPGNPARLPGALERMDAWFCGRACRVTAEEIEQMGRMDEMATETRRVRLPVSLRVFEGLPGDAVGVRRVADLGRRRSGRGARHGGEHAAGNAGRGIDRGGFRSVPAGVGNGGDQGRQHQAGPGQFRLCPCPAFEDGPGGAWGGLLSWVADCNGAGRLDGVGWVR